MKVCLNFVFLFPSVFPYQYPGSYKSIFLVLEMPPNKVIDFFVLILNEYLQYPVFNILRISSINYGVDIFEVCRIEVDYQQHLFPVNSGSRV
jgi:hypothetical protein